MGRIEGDLGLDEPEQGSVVWEELAIEEQQILLEDTETAVDAKRSEIDHLIGEGQQLLRELDSSKSHISSSLFLIFPSFFPSFSLSFSLSLSFFFSLSFPLSPSSYELASNYLPLISRIV